MRRSSFIYLAALAPFTACKRYRRPNPAATVEEPTELAPRVSMANPRDESQLLNGFYEIEGNSWRWTGKKFAISLQPPLGGAVEGAQLELDCAVADAIAGQMLPLTLKASVGGFALTPQRLTAPGRQTVSFPVPKEALAGPAKVVEFELDKTGQQGEESRELGLIVVSIGFVEP